MVRRAKPRASECIAATQSEPRPAHAGAWNLSSPGSRDASMRAVAWNASSAPERRYRYRSAVWRTRNSRPRQCSIGLTESINGFAWRVCPKQPPLESGSPSAILGLQQAGIVSSGNVSFGNRFPFKKVAGWMDGCRGRLRSQDSLAALLCNTLRSATFSQDTLRSRSSRQALDFLPRAA